MFGWEQADNVHLRRCSRCKVPSYCDKDCQAEHWEKHHKQQCRALAGRKPEPLAGHRGAACPDCQAEDGRPLACHIKFSFGRWDNLSTRIILNPQ